MSELIADLRFAVRVLARSPWFTLFAVLTLGLGIGATTALFSLVDAVVLRDLPYGEPRRLVEIWGRDDRRAGMRVPGAMLEALRSRSKTLQAIGTHDPSAGVFKTSDGAVDIRGETVSANFVDVFGVAPMMGRGFLPDEERPGEAAVMLVSFAFWRQYLGEDPDAVGRAVYLGGVPHTVIGVMPPRFRTRFLNLSPEFWTVHAGNRSRQREREMGYELVARMAPGVTIEQARREVDAISAAVQVNEWRGTGRRIEMVPLKEEVVGNRAYALTLLMVGIGVVLAIACANLAQLLLARSDRRITEFATRKAIGAGSGQLFRLALVESLLLSAAGGAVGVVLAYWGLPMMRALAPSEIPRLADASVDTRVMAAAFVISMLTGCAVGLAPAVRLSRLSVLQAMRPASGIGARSTERFRSALVVTQVAAAVTLLALAGLIVRTFLTLVPSSPGFATESRAAFVFAIRENQFPDVADRRRRIQTLIQNLEAAPGIVSAAVASGMPFGDDEPRNIPVRTHDDGRPVDDSTLRADLRGISAKFIELLRIPVREGRAFAASDRGEASRVALVNQTLARRLAPSGSVIGQSVRVGNSATAPTYQVVGVLADTRWWGTTLAPLNEVYIPLDQDRASFGFLIVHSALDITSLTRTMKTAFGNALPDAPLPAGLPAIPLDDMVGRSIAGLRFTATLASGFSAMAMLLAVFGLFGLVAYSVSQRHHELGIRAALGARPADLILTTIRSALLLTAAGIGLGVVAGTNLTAFIESQLYAVDRLDVGTFAGAALVMMLAACLGAYLPAHRAAHMNPMKSLRHQ